MKFSVRRTCPFKSVGVFADGLAKGLKFFAIIFDSLVNINDVNAFINSMTWITNVGIDGTFSSTTGGSANGTFYGTGHTEVGSTFDRNGIRSIWRNEANGAVIPTALYHSPTSQKIYR